jgi:hypothetical protein
MKRRFVGLFIALLSIPAFAQTVANGPYYAEPAWDQQLPTAQRFIVLANWASQAVLDRETGLVWERDPVTAHPIFEANSWVIATEACTFQKTGGRAGWRLPSFHALASLFDPSVTSGLALPAGHPFLNIALVPYWSSTTSAGDSTFAYGISLQSGVVVASTFSKATPNRIWCVRGGGPIPVY